MFKKIILLIVFYLSVFNINILNATTGLPGDTTDELKSGIDLGNAGSGISIISNLIGNLIQYVAVFAVIALILSGFMYLISGGEEEKVKKAKSWIIWSLVGVILSVSAWGIINMLNNITIK